MGNQESSSKKDDNDDSDVEDMDLMASNWTPSNYGLSLSDRRALTKFYRAAGGDKWRTRTSWLKQSPVGMWYGVSVASRNGEKQVTSLVLHHNKLRGDFSKSALEFSKIIHLEVLNLGGNQLKGKIPPELCMVEKLRELELNDNRLTGPVPEFLSKMPRMKKVNLASNNLTGLLSMSLPVNFARNNILEVFDVNHNNLGGNIWWQWGNIGSLKELGLGGNLFTGDIPESLCNLSNLTRMDLHENMLDTEIPNGMHNLKALKELRLHGNPNIEGELPRELLQIGRLDCLSLQFE